ncbi:hypothetical protein [Rhizobium sp. S163]|uniref:hypothetical protein n=1 Tax=Rhizobium sp. S163 TaxID=3055039 RepID=UPI0025A9EBDA|nr:hypothetical protein [Rhizobium sp. S163]MDM9645766.1 hypothetical protein [Rhizobium sp. S163]
MFALVIGPLLVCVDVATTGAERIYDPDVSGLFPDGGDLYQSVSIDMDRTNLTYRVPIQWHAILGKLKQALQITFETDCFLLANVAG